MRRTHSKSILETFVIDDIEYSITDSKNAIVSKVLSSSKEVEIPSTVLHNEKEYDIVELGKKCIDESKIASLSFKSDSKIHTFNKDCLSSKTLFKLTIPNNLTTLKVDWCNNSRCLSQIQISDPNDSFCIDEKGALFDKDKTTLFFCPRNIKEYVIPKTVKRIREYAFEQCRVIKSLSFEEGSQIENIDNWAMASTSFPVLIFPNTIKTIGNNCFFWTKKLMQVSFSEGPNKIESIKNSVFKQSSLKSIEIPPSVKTLGIGVFQKCANLEKVTLLANNCQITIGRDCFSDTPETFRLVIFDSVTLVGDGVPGPELITIIADDKGVGSIETNSEIGESSHNSEKIKNKEKSKAEKSKKKDKSRKSEKSKKKSKSEKKSKKVKPYENKSENETKPENEIKSGKQILGGFNSHISDSELPSI
ncbi:hypothetical protein TRFO_12852 [Tritrichomonas foetus]|uniref:Surface antigen BspA-like n=1 Tax=Tritrichomonas foetus TaxID=1144522 RepID=A0A1J4KZW9_9EUKA|nr:hypothetical protein TRFO_12852 [Tritrichomonas foetus]|eukprot:OHT16795.1 hypothetical protein TRFO_12852 [Tritrichomonas foetus]